MAIITFSLSSLFVGLRVYKGKVAYLPATNYTKHLPISEMSNEVNDKEHSRSMSVGSGDQANGMHMSNTMPDFGILWRSNLVRSHSVGADSQELSVEDGHLENVNSPTMNGNLVENDIEDKKKQINGTVKEITEDISVNKNEHLPYTRYSNKNQYFNSETVDGEIQVGYSATPVKTPLLPPLNEPVPQSWTVIEDEFVLACPVYQTHLGSDSITVPYGEFADGVIHLVIIRKGIPRSAMLTLFREMEVGKHAGNPYIEIIPCKAFRLEPDLNEDVPVRLMTVDGEQVEYGPVQGQVLPGLARIISLSNTSSL